MIEEKIKQLGIHPKYYSIDAIPSNANDVFCLIGRDAKWEVFYAERGEKFDLEKFASREAAENNLLARLEKVRAYLQS